MTLCFAEEQTPETSEVLRRLDLQRAFVPAVWHFEVCNVLWLGIRRRRISLAEAKAFLGRISSFDVETRETPLQSTLTLATMMEITFYDAAYLALAEETGLSLATLDKRLRAAAVKRDVPVLPA